MTALLRHLVAARADGRKLLVPYLMGGMPDRIAFPDAIRALERHADAVEVGLPYSDPLMDGPLIAGVAERVLREGIGPLEAMNLASEVPPEEPRLAMTYFNPIHRVGEEEFCRRASDAGFVGLIVPDLPHEESAALRDAAAARDLAWVPLVSPTSSPERVAEITATATGFIYAVSTLGVTGTRQDLSERAAKVVASCRESTDLPILVGIGVSSPEHAISASESADGVVIGSAVVRLLLDEGADAASTFLQEVRRALDAGRV